MGSWYLEAASSNFRTLLQKAVLGMEGEYLPISGGTMLQYSLTKTGISKVGSVSYDQEFCFEVWFVLE